MIRPDKNIPTSNSAAQEWIQWYESLDTFLGPKTAKALFTQAWAARGGTGARGNTSDLRSYLSDKGLSIETTGIQDVTDFGVSVGDAIGSFLTTSKWIAIGGLTVTAVSILLIAYGTFKHGAPSVNVKAI